MAIRTLEIPDESIQCMLSLWDITGIKEKTDNDRLAKLFQDGVRIIEYLVYVEFMQGRSSLEKISLDPLITPGKEDEVRDYFAKTKLKPE